MYEQCAYIVHTDGIFLEKWVICGIMYGVTRKTGRAKKDVQLELGGAGSAEH